MFFLKRLALAMLLSACSESAIAQDYSNSHEAHFARIGDKELDLPYLAQIRKGVVEVRCSYADSGEDIEGLSFFCPSFREIPVFAKSWIATFDDDSPYLEMRYGKVRLRCHYGKPMRTYHPNRRQFLCR